MQLYDMHQALHRSQNLFQSRSTVSDERHSAAATKSNTVETASSSNQVPPLIPIESQSQQPVPSTSSSSTTESDAQNTTDREATKNKLIKQQLVLLLHASKCQKENGINKEVLKYVHLFYDLKFIWLFLNTNSARFHLAGR